MAGRHQNNIPPDAPYQEFALDLRELRSQAGLTLDDIADISGKAKSTLSTAMAGYTLPTWEVVGAILDACGANRGDWGMRWRRLKFGDAPDETPSGEPVQMGRHGRAPTPDFANTSRQFMDTLLQLKIWMGKESLRDIQRKTESIQEEMRLKGQPGRFFLSRTALSNAFSAKNRNRLPDRPFLEAFLTYAEVSPRDRTIWIQAWQRITYAEETATQTSRIRKPKMRMAPGPKAEGGLRGV